MAVDSWLPIGYELPDGGRTSRAVSDGAGWQIFATAGGGAALVVQPSLADRWLESGLIGRGQLAQFTFGPSEFVCLSCGEGHRLVPVDAGRSPNSKLEAVAFALALAATRKLDPSSPLQDSIYVERITRLLPTYSISPRVDDDIVLGMWLTGGVRVSVGSGRRLQQLLSWLRPDDLREIVESAGIRGGGSSAEVSSIGRTEELSAAPARSASGASTSVFELPGRPELAAFFNEHVVEIVEHQDRYRAMGIGFPSPVVLHGPPGCGKTFAVERLVEFLGWPSFKIDASSVASPYIHETSKKVADVFERAMKNAPSVLIIDEMEAFLADREVGSGHHRVEEVAEFLRRIPEAAQNQVWIAAMTNRIDMIDPAILRRGRFDHVIAVEFPTEEEVLSLLGRLLASIPVEDDVRPGSYARDLAGRPLSDVAFVVREGARLAARDGRDRLNHRCMVSAIKASAARTRTGSGLNRRIGFSERT